MASLARIVAGVDGCRNGWVVVTTGLTPGSSVDVGWSASVAAVIDQVRAGELVAVGIDMPIGLADDGTRTADAAARQLLGPRRSSLFPTPPRDVLAATDYADALARCRAASGKGLSVQAYNLLAKMRELGEAVDASLQPTISEVHPETSFAVLRGMPCAFSKRTIEGRAERIDALRGAFPQIDTLTAATPAGARPDDVLDAFGAAWTARRMATGNALVLGNVIARDALGLRLTITA